MDKRLFVDGKIFNVVFGETPFSLFATVGDTDYLAWGLTDEDNKQPIIRITPTETSKAFDEWDNRTTATYVQLRGGQ